VQSFYLQALPWIDCVLQKFRYAESRNLRNGVIKFGLQPADWIEEHGVRYALDLRLNQDASFYPDTRHLRAWIIANSQGQRVLNLFAYTGSLGVAALAGQAQQVIQVDLKKKFLDLARRSVNMNAFDLAKMLLDSNDFFSRVAFYKRQGARFEQVIVDAPFFSTTRKGSVDLINQSVRLVNKLRPLVADGGRLVVVNNALFLSGKDFIGSMQALCQDGYLSIEQSIPIPEDICGYSDTIVRKPPVDPAPFNHPTKILVMTVRRKQ
jgi:23S rRNA (cytosine1962-C5)-methyltransferase